MDVAVLPQVNKIVQMIREEKPEDEIRLAAEAFTRVYSPYEMPVCTVQSLLLMFKIISSEENSHLFVDSKC